MNADLFRDHLRQGFGFIEGWLHADLDQLVFGITAQKEAFADLLILSSTGRGVWPAPVGQSTPTALGLCVGRPRGVMPGKLRYSYPHGTRPSLFPEIRDSKYCTCVQTPWPIRRLNDFSTVLPNIYAALHPLAKGL